MKRTAADNRLKQAKSAVLAFAILSGLALVGMICIGLATL